MAEVDTKMRDAALHVSDVKDASFKPLPYKPVSADSHITEPPNTYSDYIDPTFRDVAPKVIKGPTGGDVFVIPGMEMQIPMGGMAAAGRDPREMRMDTATFDEIHRSAWDGKARVADQDIDGVAGEIIYPTVGMLLCNHPDKDYKNACFHAYNRWLQEFCSTAPHRLVGLGQ